MSYPYPMTVIERDGFKLQCRIEGSGPPALVIGSALYYPRSFSQNLRRHLQLVFMDWRGFAEGSSSRLAFEDILEDIDQVRSALGLKKCIVIGHSAHGLLALEYAKKYPQHTTHVVMIGISPNLGPKYAEAAERNWQEAVWPERKEALAARLKEFPDEVLAKLPPAERFVAWNVRRSPQSWFDYHFDSAKLWEGVVPNMPLMDFLYGVVLRDLDISLGLEAFHKPVFLALGRFDYIIAPPCAWDPFRPKFHNLTVRVFERSGHSPHQEEAPLFDAELLRWIAR